MPSDSLQWQTWMHLNIKLCETHLCFYRKSKTHRSFVAENKLELIFDLKNTLKLEIVCLSCNKANKRESFYIHYDLQKMVKVNC